jgi:hypothetical protein
VTRRGTRLLTRGLVLSSCAAKRCRIIDSTLMAPEVRMSPLVRRSLPILAVLALCNVTSPRSSIAQSCGPGACTGGAFHHIDFESLAPGAPVEGLGALDPDLAVASQAWPFGTSCVLGRARVLEEGNSSPYASWGTSTGVINGCLNGTRGFADNQQCVLDYDFTFASGITVSCFSILMVDYGDYFPFGGTTHEVFLTAYDVGNNIVDQDQLTMSGGVDSLSGDACTSQAGQPGNFRLVVSAPGIVKVSLTFDRFPDPNIGFDDITFCETIATFIGPTSWGTVKTFYR